MRYGRRRIHRKDSNSDAIVAVARKIGFLVYPRNDDLADLDVQIHGQHEIWEVKMPKGDLSQKQVEARAEGWRIRTVRTAEDVLNAHAELLARAAVF